MSRVVRLALLGVAAGVVLALATAQHSMDTAQFWAQVHVQADEAEHYDDLASMRDAADAVVLGRIMSITNGRSFGEPPLEIVYYVTAHVQVDRILAGSVVEGVPGQLRLEIMVPSSASMDEVLQASPSAQSVFFLRHKGTELAALGAPPEIVAADELFYRLVILRGVVWDERGRASVNDTGETDFLSQLAGRPFQEIVSASTR